MAGMTARSRQDRQAAAFAVLTILVLVVLSSVVPSFPVPR